MSSLKEEYALHKAQRALIIYKETKEQLESEVLIVEKLDTATISSIVDAMNEVETALTPFFPKLKSVKAALDAAEAELMGLVSKSMVWNRDKKTSAMLGKALALYQGLSQFLANELTVLLKSRIFSKAKESPTAPVGPQMIPMFKRSLKQDVAAGILNKLFSSTNIPYINNDQLATELSTMTFAELKQLTEIGKMPTVLPQAEIQRIATDAMQIGTQGSVAAPAEDGPAPGLTPMDYTSRSGGGSERNLKISVDTQKKVQAALDPWVSDPRAVQAVLKALGQ